MPRTRDGLSNAPDARQSVLWRRRAGEADVRQPRRRVGQQRLDAAVALLLVLADNQAGEQLGEGEILTTEAGAVIRKAGLGEEVRLPNHLPW